MTLQEAIAKYTGKKSEDVTPEDVKSFEAMQKELVEAGLNAAPVPKPDPQVYFDPKHLEEIDALKAANAATVKQLGDLQLALERKDAEAKAPDLDPDESRIAVDRLSRIKSIPDILRLVSAPAQDEDWKAAQTVWDDLYLLGTVKFGSLKLSEDSVRPARGVKHLKYFADLQWRAPKFAECLQKAIDTETTGEGVEWAPTRTSDQLVEAVYAATNVAQLFPRIPQPADTFVMPFGLTSGTSYLQGEAITDLPAEYTKTTPTTAAPTLTAKKLAAAINYSQEAEEDSIVPLLAELRKTIVRIESEAIEEAVISGDTTATHMDSIVTSAADRRHAWDGLRHQSLVTDSTLQTLASFYGERIGTLLLGEMTQKYLEPPLENTVFLVPTKMRTKWLMMRDTSDSGSQPIYLNQYTLHEETVLRGQVTNLFGHPVILSGWIPTNLNASGVYDGTTTTKTNIIVVNRNSWLLGDRKALTIELDRQIRYGVTTLVAVWRGSFTKTSPSGDYTTIVGYNCA